MAGEVSAASTTASTHPYADDEKVTGQGVMLSLANGGTGGWAIDDTYYNIQNAVGSKYDDVIAGDKNANVLDGGDGSDTLQGGGGADTFNGGVDADGKDVDIVTFEGAKSGVTAD